MAWVHENMGLSGWHLSHHCYDAAVCTGPKSRSRVDANRLDPEPPPASPPQGAWPTLRPLWAASSAEWSRAETCALRAREAVPGLPGQFGEGSLLAPADLEHVRIDLVGGAEIRDGSWLNCSERAMMSNNCVTSKTVSLVW